MRLGVFYLISMVFLFAAVLPMSDVAPVVRAVLAVVLIGGGVWIWRARWALGDRRVGLGLIRYTTAPCSRSRAIYIQRQRKLTWWYVRVAAVVYCVYGLYYAVCVLSGQLGPTVLELVLGIVP
jgi:hypothetical protein